MKRLLVLVILVFISGHNSLAQTPYWSWAKDAAALRGSKSVKGMGSDGLGNTYALGYTVGGIQFGSFPALQPGMFLVKHDPQGNPVWSFGADCMPYGFATDSVGNSYVTGAFRGTLQLGTHTLICQGMQDTFVAKFDSAGNVVWARRAGGIGLGPMVPQPILEEDIAFSLGIDAAGSCYIGGVYTASDSIPAMFDTIAVFPPVPSYYPVSFNVLAKYNASGQIQWVKTINSSQFLTATVGISKQGQCYMSGVFHNTIDYNGNSLTSSGQNDICLASFDTNGNLSWVKSFGGSSSDLVSALAVDKRGNVLFTGSFRDTVHFGNTTLVKPPTSSGSSTLFLAKLDSAGNVLWASQATGTGSAGDSKITLDAAGNSYVCSAFRNGVTIGSQTFASVNALEDVLVSKWDTAGNPVWAIAAVGGGIDMPAGIALDPLTSECYVAGTFEYALNFGNIGLQTGPNTNFFLAKIGNVVSGLPDNTISSDFNVYPNPAQQRFSVQVENGVTGREGTFQLYSVTGQLVREVAFANTSRLVVERNDLPSGLYMYRLQTGNTEVKTGKIVLY